jgi:hypothetical protein
VPLYVVPDSDEASYSTGQVFGAVGGPQGGISHKLWVEFGPASKFAPQDGRDMLP